MRDHVTRLVDQELAPCPPGADALSRYPRPITVAHRHGNSAAALRRAQERGVDVVEVDLWLHHGRIEVRHARTLGPLPVLWERWSIRPGWKRRQLRQVLDALAPGTTLLLDLKGTDARLSARLVEALAQARPGEPLVVCSQSWGLLDALRDTPHAERLLSIGSAGQLPQALRRLEEGGWCGVSIHHSLLSRTLVRALHTLVPTVLTWTVNDATLAEQVLAMGVDGVISDDLDLLVRLSQSQRPSAER